MTNMRLPVRTKDSLGTSKVGRACPSLSCICTNMPGTSRLPSGPNVADSEVISSSRIASSGGLVTWAKSWVK